MALNHSSKSNDSTMFSLFGVFSASKGIILGKSNYLAYIYIYIV